MLLIIVHELHFTSMSGQGTAMKPSKETRLLTNRLLGASANVCTEFLLSLLVCLFVFAIEHLPDEGLRSWCGALRQLRNRQGQQEVKHNWLPKVEGCSINIWDATSCFHSVCLAEPIRCFYLKKKSLQWIPTSISTSLPPTHTPPSFTYMPTSLQNLRSATFLSPRSFQDRRRYKHSNEGRNRTLDTHMGGAAKAGPRGHRKDMVVARMVSVLRCRGWTAGSQVKGDGGNGTAWEPGPAWGPEALRLLLLLWSRSTDWVEWTVSCTKD